LLPTGAVAPHDLLVHFVEERATQAQHAAHLDAHEQRGGEHASHGMIEGLRPSTA